MNALSNQGIYISTKSACSSRSKDYSASIYELTKDTNITNTVSGIDTRLGAVENAVATKAEKTVVEGIEGRVGTLETNLATTTATANANKGKIEALTTTVSDNKAAADATQLALESEINRAKAAEQANTDAIGVASKPESVEGAGDGVVATGLHKKIEDEIARATGVENGLNSRLTTAESEIDTLQETIKGLSGAMHFEGVVESDPTAEDFDKAGYEEGDVVIFGNKEYVFDGGNFKEFGDASINAEAISGLAERVGANETAITNLGKADEDNLAAAKKYTDDAIAAIPEYELPIADADTLGGVLSSTGDNAVTVAADGKMSVETVNANTLTQTSGDFLVLKGGNASSVLRMKETITE